MPLHTVPLTTKVGRIASHAVLSIMEWISTHAADMVACSSSETRDIVSERYGVTRSKCIVFPKGINPTIFRAANQPFPPDDVGNRRREQSILFVGRLDPRKRVVELIRWFLNSSGRPERKLVIVGSQSKGRYARNVEELLRRAGARIQREVDISDLDLQRLYAAAGCLVITSWSEGEGIVALEALASGCPVVCTRPIAKLLKKDFPEVEVTGFDDWSDLSYAVDHAIATPGDQRRRNAEYLLANATWEIEWRTITKAWLRLVNGE